MKCLGHKMIQTTVFSGDECLQKTGMKQTSSREVNDFIAQARPLFT